MTIRQAVEKLATVLGGASDDVMGQDYKWSYHGEGVRMALLGTHHELRDLAVRLGEVRRNAGIPLTQTHHILAQYHLAYWDMRAVFWGVDEATFERIPAENEWNLRTVLTHIVFADHNFYALVNYAVKRMREGNGRPVTVPKDLFAQTHPNVDELERMLADDKLVDILTDYAGFHDRVLREFASITAPELTAPTVWWEQDHVPARFRLHRFDAHLRQHTVQAEKTLLMLGQHPTEATRLIRILFSGLADFENVLIGAFGLGQDIRDQASATIQERTADLQKLLN
jgi:hypothetical protein